MSANILQLFDSFQNFSLSKKITDNHILKGWQVDQLVKMLDGMNSKCNLRQPTSCTCYKAVVVQYLKQYLAKTLKKKHTLAYVLLHIFTTKPSFKNLTVCLKQSSQMCQGGLFISSFCTIRAFALYFMVDGSRQQFFCFGGGKKKLNKKQHTQQCRGEKPVCMSEKKR